MTSPPGTRSVRRLHSIVITVLVAATVAAAGCGDDEKAEPTETRPESASVTEAPSTPTSPSTATSEQPTSTTRADSSDCGRAGGMGLRVVTGTPSCDVVRQVAGEYELAGPKVQTVRGWTCASGTAQTRPIVFTCSLNGSEFVAEDRG